ncbi:hypothetical protein [Tautonia plasticadhaerens]|uniref:Uncharacterized protein n=1 Tax=Tautonia plasticadhaerens TaxID=2527974 RepID=A0A518GUQ1_9BACT|nr:hypothetical protein [Tautonia plasticadhaerens]QDV32313.1 hypothetical protein ElP_01410 [Tautonia plasticadhaerens]
MSASSPRPLRISAATATLALMLSGCGGGDQGAVIEFPESQVQPVLTESKDAENTGGSMSQGDPSQYTRP